MGNVQRLAGGAIFFERRGASDNTFKLYMRDVDGQERLLADPGSGVHLAFVQGGVSNAQRSPGAMIAAKSGSRSRSLPPLSSATAAEITPLIARIGAA